MLPSRTREARPSILQIQFAVSDLFGFLESPLSLENDIEFASRDFKFAVVNVICMFHLCFLDRL